MLVEQLQKCSFDIQYLTHFIHQGKENYQRFREILNHCAKDPILKFNPGMLHESRQTVMTDLAKKVMQLHEKYELTQELEVLKKSIFNYSTPLSLHAIMFLTTLQNLCDKEQEKMFLQPARNGEIIGCYCQTQLAHGSDVQNLMTTAIYDQATETFIINTPQIGATKWWVGDLGVYCNHAAVFAQLIINGKKFGVHAFLVPIRDPKTLEVYKGIQAGDIGPKYTFQHKDNGYAIFNNYRIPRRNMLMKYHVVSKQGKYSIQGDQKISFATMLMTRSGITFMIKNIMCRNATIITRYSLLRTQFKDSTGKQIPVLNYQTQLEKVMPRIAQSYSGWFTARNILQMSNFVFQESKQGRFDRLNEAHILASATKAILSYQVLRGGQIIRRAAGGHGFSSYAGMNTALLQVSSAFTLEGEYTILLIQVGRFMFKSLLNLQKGKPLAQSSNYIKLIKQGNLQVQVNDKNISCPLLIQKILQSHSCAKLMSYGTKVSYLLNDKKLTFKQIQNHHAGILLNDVAVAHSYVITYSFFLKQVNKITDQKIKAVLTNLLLVYGIQKILQRASKFFQTQTIKPQAYTLLYNKKISLFYQLRPQALGLVEAFEFDDNTLMSAIGHSNGKPYENLINWAKQYNPLNKRQQRDEIIKTIKETKLQLKARL